MGVTFVILIHLVLIFLISTVLGIILAILTRLSVPKENRNRKIALSIFAPFLGLYTLYFSWLFGSIIVAEIKNVDIGIGDYWYIPIKEKCMLTFIDLPEQAYLEDDNKIVLDNIAFLQQTEDKILGKTYDNTYFSYNLNSQKLQTFQNEQDLKNATNLEKAHFKKAINFYIDRKNEIAGISFFLVKVIALLMSGLAIFTLYQKSYRAKISN